MSFGSVEKFVDGFAGSLQIVDVRRPMIKTALQERDHPPPHASKSLQFASHGAS